jgi:hypothetical protein
MPYAIRLTRPWNASDANAKRGGGATGVLSQMVAKLCFILVSQKTTPLQTMHGVLFEMSQPQSHSWMHRFLPVRQHAFAVPGMVPERDASRVATSLLPGP